MAVYFDLPASYTPMPGVGLMMTRYKPVLVSASAEVKPGRVYRASTGMRRDEAYPSIEDVTDELKAAVERSRAKQAAQVSK